LPIFVDRGTPYLSIISSASTAHQNHSARISSRRGLRHRQRSARGLRADSELDGKVLGALDLGNIDGQVARIGLAFRMKVIAWSQNMTPQIADAAGATLVTKDELFHQADVVTIRLILSKRTRGLVGTADLLAKVFILRKRDGNTEGFNQRLVVLC
jgi:phosphoglycerate dehydrogenase-like enzyme